MANEMLRTVGMPKIELLVQMKEAEMKREKEKSALPKAETASKLKKKAKGKKTA
jgi:hypothetical protein